MHDDRGFIRRIIRRSLALRDAAPGESKPIYAPVPVEEIKAFEAEVDERLRARA